MSINADAMLDKGDLDGVAVWRLAVSKPADWVALAARPDDEPERASAKQDR
jgi:hypothetical protein